MSTIFSVIVNGVKDKEVSDILNKVNDTILLICDEYKKLNKSYPHYIKMHINDVGTFTFGKKIAQEIIFQKKPSTLVLSSTIPGYDDDYILFQLNLQQKIKKIFLNSESYQSKINGYFYNTPDDGYDSGEEFDYEIYIPISHSQTNDIKKHSLIDHGNPYCNCVNHRPYD